MYFTSSTENRALPLGLMRGVWGVVIGGDRAGDGRALLWTGDFTRVRTGFDFTDVGFELDGRSWLLSVGGIGACTIGTGFGITAAAGLDGSFIAVGSSRLG